MPSYTPPPGGSATLSFGDSPYTAPAGSSITLELDGYSATTIYQPSIFDDGYGTPVLLWTEYLSSVTVGDVSAFGAHTVDYHRLLPDGIASTLAFGTANAYLGQQWVLPESMVENMGAGHRAYRDDFYSPVFLPDASALQIEFGTALHTAPSGASVTLEFEPPGTPTIYPVSINDSAVGSHDVKNFLLYIEPAPINDGAIGSHELELTPEIRPFGIDQSKLGFSGDGDGAITHGVRALAPASIEASLYGTQRVESTIRLIDLAGLAPLGTLFGTQFIAYRERFVYPPFIFANAFGVATIGFTREIAPAGIHEEVVGYHEVRDNTQRLESIGVGTDWVVDSPSVSRDPQIVAPLGFDLREIAPSERWGTTTVHNLTQILPRIAIDPDAENGGVFGEPNNTLVENRNRTIVHYGHADSRVSALAVIDNTGRGLLPDGMDETAWGAHLVAPAIRTYELEGIDSPWFTPYHAVYNAAFQASPAGIDQSAVGTPAWANPPQALTFVGHIDSQEHGTAFVDFAIRSIATPLGPEAVVGMPDVQLGTRYLLPVGLEAAAWGSTYIYEHFNIAAAHSILPPAMGEPYVYNVTPEVMPYGYEQTEWGRPEARFNPYPLTPEGFSAVQFGGLVIRDRTQTVLPTPVGVGGVGMFAQVRNDTPDPPAQQSVAPAGALHTGYGTAFLRRMEIDAGGDVFTVFGAHQVRLIGAIAQSIPAPSTQVPQPSVSGPRTLTADGLAAPDDPLSGFTPTKHDLSPRTIWATFDVTPQAVENHPGEWEYMDHYLVGGDDSGARPLFGSHAISLGVRAVSVGPAAAGMSPQEFPGPFVESTVRTVYPTGNLMQRFGVPTLPGEQILDHDFGGFEDAVMGGPHVVENQNRELRPAGLAGSDIDGHDVQNQHRELPATSVGEGVVGVPRIHPPEPLIPGMGVQTLWGDAMVADRIRTTYPSGWDSFTTGDEVGGFVDRMRVLKRYPLRPVAISDGALGGPRVSSAVQVVEHVTLPAPGKPPAPVVEINSKVALGGLGLWYEDHGQTVITHGDNLEFVCGESSRAIPVPGLGDGALGSHGVAHG